MRQGTISEFEQGRLFGRQELLIMFLNNRKSHQLKDGDFYIPLSIIQGILDEETAKYGQIK